MAVPLQTITAFLDHYLRVAEIPDDPNALNGLQAECARAIGRVASAVDCSLASLEAAAGLEGEDASTLLLVHHGLSWGGNQPLVGRHARRVRTILGHDLALYSAHIPLDLHPEIGNNVLLARLLEVRIEGWFGAYRGVPIGVYGRRDPLAREQLVQLLDQHLETGDAAVRLIPGGPTLVSRIGIVSGAAVSMLQDARDLELDAFITGEGKHHSFFDAMEWGLNLILAGHYATETFGVRALGELVAKRFGIPHVFINQPTGM